MIGIISIIGKNITNVIAGVGVLITLCACNDVMGGLYDEAKEEPEQKPDQLYVDASSWTDWQYIDLDALRDGSTSSVVQTIAIPSALTGETDGKSGIYNYWFDVWEKGLDNNEFKGYEPTDAQPEPPHWSIAIHREVVRTNSAEVLKTEYTSMNDVPTSSAAFSTATFIADEWSETQTWFDNSLMLSGVIGCQGIYLNKVLSQWITCSLPPIPPAYSMDNHVFILRYPDGRHIALQLADYISPKGKKCCFTINYKFLDE